MMTETRRGALLAGLGLGLTGCGIFGSSPTGLNLTIAASSQLNPNPSGVPAPLALKFFELVSADAFGTASFSALFYTPNDALRSDLLNTFGTEITPGSSAAIRRTLNGQAQYLGIVAGYRDIGNAIWRLTRPLNVHGGNRVRLVVGRLALSFPPAGGWF
jgi:type VI secretion system protein VasD